MAYFYVISPVGSDPDFARKRAIIESAGAACGIKPFFPLEQPEEISLERAKADLQGAAFVVADLSMERPSCYFELGLAQSLNQFVFLIAKRNTNIHQTLGRTSVEFYEGIGDYAALIIAIIRESVVRELKQ